MGRSMSAELLSPGAPPRSTGGRGRHPLSRLATRTVGSVVMLLLAGCAGLDPAPPRPAERIDNRAGVSASTAPSLLASGLAENGLEMPLVPAPAGMVEPAPAPAPASPSPSPSPSPRAGVPVDAGPQAAVRMPKTPSTTALPPSGPAEAAAAAARSTPVQASVQSAIPAAANSAAKAAATSVASSAAKAAPPAPAQALARPAATPPLDLQSLEARLKATPAIGVFTKLTLKNQIDDLLAQFRAYYRGQLKLSLAALRQSFDRLVVKVLALLQDADPALALAIEASRESIWGILSNPAKFAAV